MALDLTNPVKKDEWARSVGFDGWNQYVDSGGSEQTAQMGVTNPSQLQGGGGLPSVDDYIKAIVDTLPEPPPPYSEVNPFYFDEQNATELATAEFSPYYDELLQDYMGDYQKNLQRLGDDKMRVLQEMEAQKDYYVQNKQTDLQRLIRGIKLGYEGQGLYQSGFRRKDIAESQSDYENNLQDYMRQYQYGKTGTETTYNRNVEDIGTDLGRYQRDIGREKETAIAGQVQNLKGEAMDEYLLGAQTYYSQPNWGSAL